MNTFTLNINFKLMCLHIQSHNHINYQTCLISTNVQARIKKQSRIFKYLCIMFVPALHVIHVNDILPLLIVFQENFQNGETR